jgi:hypothetical protein
MLILLFLYAIDIDEFYFHLVSAAEQRKIFFLFLCFIDKKNTKDYFELACQFKNKHERLYSSEAIN